MTELQQNRYDQLLRRVGDLKGPGSKVNDVLQELFAMIDVENIPDELQILSGTRLCMEGAALAAGVGNIAKIQLFNPVGSGQIATIDMAYVSSPSATVDYNMSLSTTEFATVADIGLFRDSRLAITQRPTCKVQTLADAVTVSQNTVFRVLASTTLKISGHKSLAVLAPGTALLIGPDVTNISCRVTFFWRERVALPSELSF